MKTFSKIISVLIFFTFHAFIVSCISSQTKQIQYVNDVNVEWTEDSDTDSLSMFCSDGKCGYYNSKTGEIIIDAQYVNARNFSEGLAAVWQNGKIGFINCQGKIVIDFQYPDEGNPLYSFKFHKNVCAVANEEGKCGLIDKDGNWVIKPEWDDISMYDDYIILKSGMVKRQAYYDGKVMDFFILDDVTALSYGEDVFYLEGGKLCIGSHYTGLYAYQVSGRWGLLDSSFNRLTDPIYGNISAVGENVILAELPDGFSSVVLNFKGEVMK